MNDAVALVARVLLSALFIVIGARSLMNVGGTAGFLGRSGVPSPQIVAWAVIAVELIGGLMVLVGFKARWAALGLCVFTAATIYLGHKFWIDASQLTHALKNLGIMGGFLLLFANGPGRYSVDGR
jgi:putative oxidoreductase